MSYETEPVEVPPHVRVVSLRAAFVVECSACGESVWLYHVAVAKDHGAIRKAVETHGACARAA